MRYPSVTTLLSSKKKLSKAFGLGDELSLLFSILIVVKNLLVKEYAGNRGVYITG